MSALSQLVALLNVVKLDLGKLAEETDTPAEGVVEAADLVDEALGLLTKALQS